MFLLKTLDVIPKYLRVTEVKKDEISGAAKEDCREKAHQKQKQKNGAHSNTLRKFRHITAGTELRKNIYLKS